jgi:Domain of unknown function (DUF4157)
MAVKSLGVRSDQDHEASVRQEPVENRSEFGETLFETAYSPILNAAHGADDSAVMLSKVKGEARAQMMTHLQQTIGNKAVQRLVDHARSTSNPTGDLAQRIEAAASNGSAMDAAARHRLEAGLGADFSGVRVHTDREADELSREVSAAAFTTGSHIFFREGAYQPNTLGGLRLIAHEAAHTLQQASGPVDGTPRSDGVSISDPADSFEQAADHAADQVLMGQAATVAASPGAATGQAATAVQRDDPPSPWNLTPFPPQLGYNSGNFTGSLSPGGVDLGLGQYHLSGGASPTDGSWNASAYYGSPLLPFPGDVTHDVNAGYSGLMNGQFGPALNAASTLGSLGTSPTMPFGAGLTVSSTPDDPFKIMAGIQGSF